MLVQKAGNFDNDEIYYLANTVYECFIHNSPFLRTCYLQNQQCFLVTVLVNLGSVCSNYSVTSSCIKAKSCFSVDVLLSHHILRGLPGIPMVSVFLSSPILLFLSVSISNSYPCSKTFIRRELEICFYCWQIYCSGKLSVTF